MNTLLPHAIAGVAIGLLVLIAPTIDHSNTRPHPLVTVLLLAWCEWIMAYVIRARQQFREEGKQCAD